MPFLLQNLETGCPAHDDCLTCPFRACRFEMTSHEFQREVTIHRGQRAEARIVELAALGLQAKDAIVQVAAEQGCTIRTILRRMAAARSIPIE